MTDATITTSAAGHASAPPDEVELRFSATAVEPAVTRARRAVAEQARQLRQVLDESGIPGDRVRTERFRISRRPPDRGEPPEPEPHPYHATETVAVTLLDLDRLGDTLSAAVDEAGVEIEAVVFTFRTETQRALQREAIADAVETARQKASAAAAAEQLVVGAVRSMATDIGARPRRTGTGQQLAAGAESGSVASGPIEVQVGVEVEYELSEA